MVAIMPQGTIPRGPAFFDPELKGRWGAARLAQLTGAPVIPVGLWGTEKVWPRSRRGCPTSSTCSTRREVTASVGKPVELKYKSLDADTKRIMKAIVRAVAARGADASRPDARGVAATYPPGYKGTDRRPDDRRPARREPAASRRDEARLGLIAR